MRAAGKEQYIQAPTIAIDSGVAIYATDELILRFWPIAQKGTN